MAGDLGNLATAKAVVERAVSAFGRIDSLIVNHGVLDPVSKVADANVDEWKTSFDIGFFGVVALVISRFCRRLWGLTNKGIDQGIDY